MRAKLRVSVVTAALIVICGLEFLVIHPSVDPLPLQPLPLIAVAWVLFAGAAWLSRRLPLRWAVALIIIGAIAVQIVAVSGPPQSSTDLYRYMWDGRVQAAGYDPYAYVPTAPQLAHIRDPFLFNHHAQFCVGSGIAEPGYPGRTLAPGCTRINRPTVPTIYPPVAELYFLAVHYVTPVWAGSTPVQAAAGACAVLVTLLLLAGLWWLGRDLRWAALWAWCPTVALEAGNNAHVDVVAVLLTLGALLVLARRGARRPGALLGGTLLGLAIATKMTPVLVAPAVLKRRWVAVVTAAAGAVAAVYLPHVLAVGSRVVGFLPGYLQQEGYDSGQRFALISLFATGKVAVVIAVLVLTVTGLAVLRFSDPDQPWRAAMVMTGMALIVTTPKYQWYAILLVMLVVLDGRPEWLALAAGGYLGAEPHLGRWREVPHAGVVGYGLATLFVVAVSLLRWQLAGIRNDWAGSGRSLGLKWLQVRLASVGPLRLLRLLRLLRRLEPEGLAWPGWPVLKPGWKRRPRQRLPLGYRTLWTAPESRLTRHIELMSYQGPGRHRPQDDRDGPPWPGHQPDVFDYPAPDPAGGPGGWDRLRATDGQLAEYAELVSYRRAGYADYQAPPGSQAPQGSQTAQGSQAPHVYRAQPDAYQAPWGTWEGQGHQIPQSYQAPQGYHGPDGHQTSAVIIDPAGYPEPASYPDPASYPEPDSDEFAAPLIDPAPVGTPPEGFPAGGSPVGAAPASDGDQDPAAYVGLAPPAPGRGPTPGAWRRRGRGLLAGLTSGLLSAAVAVTVAVLAAALLRPQASPVTAVAAMLRSGALAHFAGQHFGARGHAVLLALTSVVIVGVAVALGLTASKRRAAGVIGMAAAFGAAAAFAVLTRPGSRAADVIPSLVGGMAGAAALALLAGAAAPQVVLARAVIRARAGYRRTGELDVVGTNRRRFLLASLSVTAVVAVAGTAGQLLTRKGVKAPKPEVAGPVQKLPPLPASAKLDNIAGISPFYTPNAKFYRVDTALVVPRVTAQEWKLRVHGMVDKPVTIDFEDLLSRPQLQRDITMVCVSESVGGGYIGSARWQGARLADLLREAGVHPGATQIVMRDVHGMALGVSTESVMDGRDALLATKMNGQPLPAEHGYPVRVVVPGLYGYVSACKWVVDMELTTYAAYDAYWSKRGWTAQAAVKTESRIDTPKAGKQLQAGQVVIAGVAWATHKGIARVEVGVDGDWAEATLATQDTIDTWRQWYFRWDATPGPHTLQVRATDQTGYTQTAAVHGPPPSGATGYHTVKVTVA